jgi:3-phenylpropionate/trans-cinnamate dioxygenase ferredoxin reductase subunit
MAGTGDGAGVVIVGAGQAGLACAARLRAGGYAGPVTLIGEEPDAPYQRPPLSKAYLLDRMSPERLALRPPEWYGEQRITLRSGTAVERLDREGRRALLSDGSAIPYAALVLATGAAARPLPAALSRGLTGLHSLRDRADIDLLRPELAEPRRVLVIGGGYIGLEIAAVARGLGHEVDLVEMAPGLLARVACPETAEYLAELHCAQGVRLWLGRGVKGLTGTGRVQGAVLSDGTEIAADLVIAGIGAHPRTELAEAAGLAVDNGIRVDARGRSSDPAIFAAGDCASYALPGGSLRLESVGNAIDTGETVARSILQDGPAYIPRPWFWSDQFGLKLQIAGCARPGDSVQPRHPPEEGRSHWYFRDGRLVAVDAFNAPRAYQAGRRMIEAGLSPRPEVIGDPAWSLKAILDDLQLPPQAPQSQP